MQATNIFAFPGLLSMQVRLFVPSLVHTGFDAIMKVFIVLFSELFLDYPFIFPGRNIFKTEVYLLEIFREPIRSISSVYKVRSPGTSQ